MYNVFEYSNKDNKINTYKVDKYNNLIYFNGYGRMLGRKKIISKISKEIVPFKDVPTIRYYLLFLLEDNQVFVSQNNIVYHDQVNYIFLNKDSDEIKDYITEL